MSKSKYLSDFFAMDFVSQESYFIGSWYLVFRFFYLELLFHILKKTHWNSTSVKDTTVKQKCKYNIISLYQVLDIFKGK